MGHQMRQVLGNACYFDRQLHKARSVILSVIYVTDKNIRRYRWVLLIRDTNACCRTGYKNIKPCYFCNLLIDQSQFSFQLLPFFLLLIQGIEQHIMPHLTTCYVTIPYTRVIWCSAQSSNIMIIIEEHFCMGIIGRFSNQYL